MSSVTPQEPINPTSAGVKDDKAEVVTSYELLKSGTTIEELQVKIPWSGPSESWQSSNKLEAACLVSTTNILEGALERIIASLNNQISVNYSEAVFGYSQRMVPFVEVEWQ